MSRSFNHRPLVTPSLVRLFAFLVMPLTACSTGGPADGSANGNKNIAEQAGFEKVVYAVRQTTEGTGKDVRIHVADGMGQVMDYGRYVPGARIEVRSLRTGEVENLLEGDQFANADVEGLDLGFDAKKVVFAMKLDGNDHYHIYTANLSRGDDATNPYGVAPLTGGMQEDLSPIWLANGRIAFITNDGSTDTGMGTRADEYNHSRAVTQIATITETGGDSERRLCSQNLSHTFNLFRLQSGQIGYSRWEHLENINDVKLFAMNPDCTQMIALAGQHDKPANSLIQVTETNERNVLIAIGTDRERTIQSGAIIRIDARAQSEDARHDEERAGFSVLTPTIPRGGEGSAIGRYRTPRMLPDGRLLVSWADGLVNDMNELSLTPPDFGIYIYDDATRKNQLVYNGQGTWELYAQPVREQTVPPVIDSVNTSKDVTEPLTLGSIDIKRTSLFSVHGNTVGGAQFADGTSMDEALKKAVKVRILEGFSSEGAKDVTMFGLTMAEGSALLGEAPVLADGSWRAQVPPFIPIHLQAVDEFELSIRSQTTWIQGMPGEQRICGGCHEDRTAPNTPGVQQQPFATNQAQQFMKAIDERVEYPWQMPAGQTAAAASLEVQGILDAKCVQCHNGTTNGTGPQETYTVTAVDEETGTSSSYTIGRMDLSATPVTVTYDRRTATYPMSYVSIFYPAALEMEMGMGTTVIGAVPPKWGVPSDARHSVLLEKLNTTSAFDESRTAWATGQPFSDATVKGGTRTMHPENVGVTLSRAERTALIRAFDMGGQFYSRQNTGFEAYGPGGSTTPQYPTN